MMAALEAENEVPLLLEAHEKVLRRFNLGIRILLLLDEHPKSIVEADVWYQVPRSCLLLLF